MEWSGESCRLAWGAGPGGCTTPTRVVLLVTRSSSRLGPQPKVVIEQTLVQGSPFVMFLKSDLGE